MLLKDIFFSTLPMGKSFLFFFNCCLIEILIFLTAHDVLVTLKLLPSSLLLWLTEDSFAWTLTFSYYPDWFMCDLSSFFFLSFVASSKSVWLAPSISLSTRTPILLQCAHPPFQKRKKEQKTQQEADVSLRRFTSRHDMCSDVIRTDCFHWRMEQEVYALLCPRY